MRSASNDEFSRYMKWNVAMAYPEQSDRAKLRQFKNDN